MFYAFIIFGLLIRLSLVPVPGFKADVAFWKGWGLAAADKGIAWLITNSNYNYPPGFAYVLWFINKVYSLFGNAHDINSYWADNNLLYLFLIKIITIIADLVVVWVIIKIGNLLMKGLDIGELKPKIPLPALFALFYFLNPAVIYDGVIWGQVDQVGLALFLVASYLLLVNRPKWGAVVFMVACLIKFQNIIFIPLFFLYILKKFSLKELSYSLAVFILTFLVIALPFFLNKQMDRIFWLMTMNADWFPWYSLNSFNIWWILSGLKGMQMNDKHLVLGILSAKQIGLYMFTFAYFISSVIVFFSRRENLFKNFILASSLAVFAFFHLLTQSHERYLFPVMGLLPILFLLHRKRVAGSLMLDTSFYFLTSIFFFINMYLSMGWNYPDQVIPTFTREGTIGLTWWISIVQIILFGSFIWFYLKESIKNHFLIVSIFAGLLVTWLMFKNISYLTGKPISLTELKPTHQRQDYMQPVYNKTVESARGVKYWNRLSVNYYFYDQGIGSHADSEIVYHLNRNFSKFSTDFGIDTESHQSAEVNFSILGDGKELFKSEKKGRFDKPGTTEVNVKGVNYLMLKITKAGETNFGAHADWLNPLLSK